MCRVRRWGLARLAWHNSDDETSRGVRRGFCYVRDRRRGGTVFKISPSEQLTTLSSFSSLPNVGLVLATNGVLYGTTTEGGANGQATIFSIASDGSLSTLSHPALYLAAGQSSKSAVAAISLIQATNGDFYGTGYNGGGAPSANCPAGGCGAIFRITPSGALTTIYSFCELESDCPDGRNPGWGSDSSHEWRLLWGNK
jgi:uncharacterized repeat protein (TIGR03803 family)